MFHWLLLILAIIAEVTGTLSMKWASTEPEGSGYWLMLLMITLSYLSLAIAIKRIALGVAYAIWEGVGIVLISLLSLILFDEVLTAAKVVGLSAIIIGIILINSDTREDKEASHASR